MKKVNGYQAERGKTHTNCGGHIEHAQEKHRTDGLAGEKCNGLRRGGWGRGDVVGVGDNAASDLTHFHVSMTKSMTSHPGREDYVLKMVVLQGPGAPSTGQRTSLVMSITPAGFSPSHIPFRVLLLGRESLTSGWSRTVDW